MQLNPFFHIFGNMKKHKPPRKPISSEVRPRKHLYPDEVKALLALSKKESPRDYCLMLLMYRHGLRVSEACDLKWGHVNFAESTIQINRIKNGISNTHPMRKDEIAALRVLHRKKESNYIFMSNRSQALSVRMARYIISKYCRKIGIEFPVNSHALRHSCGYGMAEAGISTELISHWMGHRAIQNTLIYTQASSRRFSQIGNW